MVTADTVLRNYSMPPDRGVNSVFTMNRLASIVLLCNLGASRRLVIEYPRLGWLTPAAGRFLHE
jgi:hypothetical protein